VYAKSILVYAKSILVYAKSILPYAKSIFIYTDSSLSLAERIPTLETNKLKHTEEILNPKSKTNKKPCPN
jgi:hypothetical protein